MRCRGLGELRTTRQRGSDHRIYAYRTVVSKQADKRRATKKPNMKKEEIPELKKKETS